jgi:hypothetical protein
VGFREHAFRLLGFAAVATIVPGAVAHDPGVLAPSSTSAGEAEVTVSNAAPFDADPFEPPGFRDAWLAPVPSAANAPPVWSQGGRLVVPQLTLRLAPIAGFSPFVVAEPWSSLNPNALRLTSDVGFRYALGRFRAGTRFSLFRDDRGLALATSTYARYVAPRYHVGLADDATWPLSHRAPSLHAVTASAGFRASKDAPAVAVSSRLGSEKEPRFAASLLGKF